MPRFKEQISIYIKKSWIDDIQKFAGLQEESVSEYIERAVSFQLLHDRKAWEKKKAEEARKDWLSEKSLEELGMMPEEKFDELIRIISKEAAIRNSRQILKNTEIYKDK